MQNYAVVFCSTQQQSFRLPNRSHCSRGRSCYSQTSREEDAEKKKTFRLHIGRVRMVQSAVSLALSQAVQVTTSEHADLPLKHISQLFQPVQITCLMTIKRVLYICFIDVVL